MMILHEISRLGKLSERNLRYGQPNCDNDALYATLLNTADISCFSPKENELYNSLIKTVSYNCIRTADKVVVTSNNKDAWEMNNPECISRKQWEKIAMKICYNYKLDISIEKIDQVCNIAFEIIKKTIDCEVLTLVSIHQKLCNLNIIIETNKNQCKIDYKMLIERHQQCNLTLKEYITLIDSNYSFEIISGIYNKNLKFEVNSKGVITLVSPINRYVLPKDLRFSEIIVDDKNNLVLPKRVLDDYNINNKLKKQILDEIYIL